MKNAMVVKKMRKRNYNSVLRILFVFLWVWATILAFVNPFIFNSENQDRFDPLASNLNLVTISNRFGATPVLGTYARLVSNTTETVYAIPTTKPIRGLILLLHACTHNALKFFSPSPKCIKCIGLSEELRIARILLERGYLILAITSQDRKSGCWAFHDKTKIREALADFQIILSSSMVNVDITSANTIAIGASSGGRFAAELVADGIAKAGLVMVMGLGPILRKRLASMGSAMPQIYLAPMPRDTVTTRETMTDFDELARILGPMSKQHVILDTETCVSLPVTPEYLHERVPDMHLEMARVVVHALANAKHLDSKLYFTKNPTTSNWRDVIVESCGRMLLEHQSLAPGLSPLAKALHRAWAFHEYCSEVIPKALTFFEDFGRNDVSH